jgi:D-alanyl-lipoteichoic acid acyltransferase DltB (MBOAT superfamily)
MIFACCVRFPLWGRILLVLTVAGPLAAVQAGWIHLPALHTVIPIIGSMFMFRIIIALYDLAHSRDEPSFTQVASYFLMLPNVCFPLFPVVDFKTFLKTYYNAPAADIYGKGVRWMMIGAVHILLYRLLSTYVSINPDQFHHIHGVVDKIRFVASDYLLYLHVSGRFHLAIGMLHLFGFNLPRTQNRYYLASSFTDLWRRINIYWTNFMQKLVYYPVATQCRRRKLSPIAGVIVASVAVVIATCLLHSYQTFWLTNLGFKMTLQDMIFWGTLGVLITGTSVYEFNHGRMRRLTASENRGINYWIKRSASTLTVFVIMCVLWSLWSSTSTRLWIDVLWSA